MPERDYMVIDPRRDHSIRNPRPDLSLEIGVPNACNKCHQDKSVPWAAEYNRKWYGEPDQVKIPYGEIFHAARQELPGAIAKLIQLAADSVQNNIIRATALSMLNRFPVPTALPVIEAALQYRDPLMRFGALQALEVLQPNDRFNLAKHLLNDPVKVVRVEAASILRSVSQTAISSAERASLNRAIDEYMRVQLFNGDRASSFLNLAGVYIQQGYFDKAEQAYQKAIALEPYFIYSYLNFADLYRGQGREKESEAILREALEIDSSSPEVKHALGLSLARQKRMGEALIELEEAVTLRPTDPGLNYVYAIALNSTGKSKDALAVLKTALEFRPTNRDLLFALTTISRDNRDIPGAIKYAQQLVEYWPYEQSYRQLLQQLRSWR
jgi:Flp pilus assembly protein TadD